MSSLLTNLEDMDRSAVYDVALNVSIATAEKLKKKKTSKYVDTI